MSGVVYRDVWRLMIEGSIATKDQYGRWLVRQIDALDDLTPSHVRRSDIYASIESLHRKGIKAGAAEGIAWVALADGPDVADLIDE